MGAELSRWCTHSLSYPSWSLPVWTYAPTALPPVFLVLPTPQTMHHSMPSCKSTLSHLLVSLCYKLSLTLLSTRSTLPASCSYSLLCTVRCFGWRQSLLITADRKFKQDSLVFEMLSCSMYLFPFRLPSGPGQPSDPARRGALLRLVWIQWGGRRLALLHV